MFSYVLLSVFPAALLIAAANDLYEFKIPNWISATLLVACFVAAFVLGAPGRLVLQCAALAGAGLVVGFALFAFNVVGGGDAKLFAAIAPWIGLSGLVPFLINMAFSGAVLAIALIVFRKTPPLPIYAQTPWVMRLHERPKDIPYGVAIAAGGLLTFPQTPFFRLVFGG
ncbi:MAG: pilus assembly protein CpaA [Alphaproteobacteria bacterium]|nr:pilus assembly protein CpaA [Alphaproteobacteria bacterium]